MVQLDGVRGFFSLLVVLIHANVLPLLANPIIVNVFFVFSGFLMTLILLEYRSMVDRGEVSAGRALFHFYGRRFLRILPVAYLCIAVSSIIYPDIRAAAAWHVLWLSNVLFSVHGFQDWNWMIGHFWSLATEEQFYLFWALLLILVPTRGFRRLWDDRQP